jgi:glycosyltransferase involved in cell wall biosynthesis
VSSISVIVSTYDRPAFLEKVLRGYAVQTDRNFELVIADDGSAAATAELIARVRLSSGLSILHVWHAHDGFRKSLILNRAIAACAGDYLIFTDGDCIPREDLVAAHRRLASRERYVAGGYIKLPSEVSDAIDLSDIDSHRITDVAWLRSKGWKPGRRALRLSRSAAIAAFFDAVTPTAADFHGNNASTWRDALYAVNGFESEMGYGGLDQALGYRLQNAGITGRQARHRAVTMHLHHDRPYKDPAVVTNNRAIMKRIRENGETRARTGLAELGPDRSLRLDRG